MSNKERSVLEYRIDVREDLEIPADVIKLAVRVEVKSTEVVYATQIYMVDKSVKEIFFSVPQDVDVELRYGFADDARDSDNKPAPNIAWSEPVMMRALDTLLPIAPTTFGSVTLVSESKGLVESVEAPVVEVPVTTEAPVETSTLPPWIVPPVNPEDVVLVDEAIEPVEVVTTSSPEVTTSSPEVVVAVTTEAPVTTDEPVEVVPVSPWWGTTASPVSVTTESPVAATTASPVVEIVDEVTTPVVAETTTSEPPVVPPAVEDTFS